MKIDLNDYAGKYGGYSMTDKDVIQRARIFAQQLSYHSTTEVQAKCLLRELCHRLDAWHREPIKCAVRLVLVKIADCLACAQRWR